MKSVMCSSSLGFFLSIVFIHLVSSTTVPDPFPHVGRCSNLTSNSAYQLQLDTLFSSITTNTESINYGFFNASTSTHQNSDAPHLIGLCRGDQRAQACQICLNTSAYELRQRCPSDKQAIVYNENCTLRYSNQTLLGQVVTNLEDWDMLTNFNNASNPDSFNQALRELFASLQTEAATGGSLRKFAAGKTTLAGFEMIFASVQCTPDLSEEQCTDCLDIVYSRLPHCCLDKIGGIFMSPSCSFRYETYRFLDLVEPPLLSLPLPPPLQTPEGRILYLYDTPYPSTPQPDSPAPLASKSEVATRCLQENRGTLFSRGASYALVRSFS